MRVDYSPHFKDFPEGHLFLDKEGACTITLTGAATMSQEELDLYGHIIAATLTKLSA